MGYSRFNLASPFISGISALLLILVAGLLGIMIGSVTNIGSSKVEPAGLYASLALHLLTFGVIAWKVGNIKLRKLCLLLGLPMSVVSCIRVDTFVM